MEWRKKEKEVWRKKVFWTWLEEMFISSNMHGDISLLNIYCSAASDRFDGFFRPQTVFE